MTGGSGRREARPLAGLLLVVFALLISADPCGAGAAPREPRSARAVVRALYAHHFQGDMAFTPESVRAKAAWIAPGLLEASLAHLASSSDPNEAPLINGDPFTDSQEYPKRFDVGRGWQPGPSLARVPVTFKGPHLARRVVVVLILVGDQWKVADVEDERGGSLAFLLGAGSPVIRAE